MLCKKCKVTTDDRCFGTYKNRKGEPRRYALCKECRNQYAHENFDRLKKWRKEYNAKNRTAKRDRDIARKKEAKEIIDNIKGSCPCKDCHRFFPPVAMDFDHIRGKNMSVAQMVSGGYKIDLILEEIKLCDVVCACCHRVRTSERKQNHAPQQKGENYV